MRQPGEDLYAYRERLLRRPWFRRPMRAVIDLSKRAYALWWCRKLSRASLAGAVAGALVGGIGGLICLIIFCLICWICGGFEGDPAPRR